MGRAAHDAFVTKPVEFQKLLDTLAITTKGAISRLSIDSKALRRPPNRAATPLLICS